MAQTIAKNTALGTKSRWYFIRSDGSYLDLPKTFMIQTPDVKRRLKVMDRLREDGGLVTGDETYDSRRVQMTYDHWAGDGEDTDYRDSLNQIEAFFQSEYRPYYLVDKTNDIRAEVVLMSHSIKEGKGLNNRYGNGMLDFQVIDGLWESMQTYYYPDVGTGAVGTQTGGVATMADGDSITVTNSGLFYAYPELEFTAQDNVVTFVLRNETTGGGFEFSSSDFVTGSVLFFSSVTGDITLNGVEKSANLTQGGPIRLKPGANVLTYESDGGDVNLSLSWRIRTAF